MKIRQIEIKDFGSIKNKTLKFTSGLNVLYDEKEQMREEVRTFIEKMQNFHMPVFSGLKAAEEITV